ncbi:MAG: hypothetical protein ABUJ92_13865 [Desulfobacterales bacterium]
MEIITDEVIRKDIEGFRNRISQAEEKLYSLSCQTRPATDDWQHRKKLKVKRSALMSGIKHIRRLITIAERALD